MIFSALFTLAAIIITVLMFIFPSNTTPTGRFGLYDTFAMWVFTYLMIKWTVKRTTDLDLYAPSYFTLLVIFITTLIGICSGIVLEYKKGIFGVNWPNKIEYDINARVALAFFLIHAGFAWPGIKDLIRKEEIEDETFESIKDGTLPNDKDDLVEYMKDDVITQEEGQKILDKKKKEAAANEGGDDAQSGGAISFINYAIRRGRKIFNQKGGDDADEEEYTMPDEDEVDFIEEASTKKKINDMIANNPYINARTTVDAPLILGWLLYIIIEPLLGTPTAGPFVNMWNSYGTMFSNLKKPTNLWGYFCQFKWLGLIFTIFTLLIKIFTLIPIVWLLKMIIIIVLILAIFFFVIEPVWTKFVYPILKKLFSGVSNMVNVSFLGTGGMMGGLSNSLL